MIWSITSSWAGEVISLISASFLASSSVGVVSAGIFSSTTFSASLESCSACTGVNKSWKVFSASLATWALYIESMAERIIKSSLAGSMVSAGAGSWLCCWVASKAAEAIMSSVGAGPCSAPSVFSSCVRTASGSASEVKMSCALADVCNLAVGTCSILSSKRVCMSFKRVRNSANSSIKASNLAKSISLVLESKPPPSSASWSNSNTEEALSHCWFPLEAEASEQISVSGVNPGKVTSSASL